MKIRFAFGAAAATIALIAPTLAVARSPIPSSRAPTDEEFLWTTTRVQPNAYLFGERVRARLDVVYDSDRVRPESVKVEPRFDPYRIVKRTRTREMLGHTFRLRDEYVLECLTDRCLPPTSGYLTFPPAHLEYRQRAARNPRAIEVEWPDLRVASRIGTSGGFGGLRFSADVRQLPPPSYRVDPGLLTAVGYSLAALFASAGLLLLARALGARALVAAALARRRARLSALHRALALVRECSLTTANGGAPSTASLPSSGRQIRSAVRATGLAWRQTAPSDPAVEPFSDEVEGLIERGAR